MFIFFFMYVGCRCAKQERRRWRIGDIFSNTKNMDSLCLVFLYFGNNLRSIKRGSGRVFSNEGSFKDDLACVLLGFFNNFSLDPYYEPQKLKI